MVKKLVVALVAIVVALGIIAKDKKEVWMNPMPVEEGRVVYRSVVSVDGADAKELKKRASRGVATIFKSYKDVTNYEDETTIKATGWTSLPSSALGPQIQLWFTVQIEVKDGKYRIVVDNIETQCVNCSYGLYKGAIESSLFKSEFVMDKNGKMSKSDFTPRAGRKGDIEKAHKTIEEFIEQIKTEMAKSTGGGGDW